MRLPFATDITSRDGTLAKDSLMKNAFAEKAGEEFDVFKRPGLALAYTLGANQGQGLVSWKGTFFAASGNVLVQGPTDVQVADGSAWTSTGGDAIVNLMVPGQVACVHNGAIFAYCYSPTELVRRSVDGITWATVATSPFGGIGSTKFSFASLGTDLFMIESGWSAGTKKVWKSTDDGANWSVVTSSPSWSARDYTTVITSGGKIWILGGQTALSTFVDDVWNSSDGNSWTQVSASAGYGGRYQFAACEHAGALYLAGGYNGTANQNDVWKSVNGGVSWTQITAAAGWSARVGLRMLSYNNKLNVMTGRGLLDDFWSSSTGATWAQKTATIGVGVSTSGEAPGAVLFGGSIYLICEASVRLATINSPGGDTYALTGAGDLPISFSQTSGAASTEYLFLKTTGKAWVLTFGSPGTLTQVTDGDYPAETVPGAAYLDGYFFVMTTAGEIYNSALENPLSWGALDFISAEIEPDDAVALGKHMNYVVAFKSTTTELFYDAANASGSPLARLSNAAIQVGCANGYSIAALDAGLFFISKFRSNQKSVHYFPKDGLQPVEIANPSIKRILTAADTSNVHCFAAQLNGHSFYVVTLVAEGITLAYDLTTQTWAQWTFLTVASADSVSSLTQVDGVATATATAHGFADGDPVTIAGATPSGYNGDVNIKRIDANTFSYPVSSALSSPATGTITATGWTEAYFPFGFYTNALGKDYVQHETSGKVYEISAEYGDDAGAPIDLKVRTAVLNQGTIDKKTMGRLSVVGDNTTGTLLARYSDDDYVTFSKYRTIDLSTTNKQVRRLGDYRERALDFRYTGDNKIRIRSIDIE